MSKRYFYTDPLAAAWMAKQFGMRVVHPYVAASGNPEMWDSDTHSFEGFVSEFPGGSRLYLHPDSLPLLEPQIGDRDEDGFIYAAQGDWRRADSTGCSIRSAGICRTAKRNGIPFMWPEVEP